MPIIDLTDPAVVADMLAIIVNDSPTLDTERYHKFVVTAVADGDKLLVTIPNPVEVYPARVWELSIRLRDDKFPAPRTTPRSGDSVGPGLWDKQASQDRAEYWTAQLHNDPVYGATSGLIVGVGPERDEDGHWPLIWVEPAT